MSTVPQVHQKAVSCTLTVRVVLTVIVVLGLAVDAYVHFHLASDYDGVKTSTLSQGDLFRAEGVLAIIAGVAVIVRPRWYTALFALLVTAGGVAAVVVYTYVNIKAFGPIPAMYEPVWFTDKTRSVWAEGIAAVASAGLIFISLRRAR
jgi:hypothetical protein